MELEIVILKVERKKMYGKIYTYQITKKYRNIEIQKYTEGIEVYRYVWKFSFMEVHICAL